MDMPRILSMVASLALLAAACGSGGDASDNRYAAEEQAKGYATAGAPPPPPPAPAMARAPEMSLDAPATEAISRREVDIIQQDPGGGGGQPKPPGQMMAYTYAWGFQVPTGNMEGLLNAHKKLCEDAGPAKCYVVNSGISGLGQESSYGTLSLKASEDWVKTFEGGVENGLKPFDGSLDSSSKSGEDLTVEIVDGEARLNSQKTMRDRLQGLLRDRPGRLSDLLEIERELARVQADIDSRESILAALKLRVAMSSLTLSYTPKYTAVSESIWRPLGDAFSSFMPNIASTLAAIIRFISEILPVVVLGGLVLWLALWQFGRRRRRKAKAVAPQVTTATPKPTGGGV
jgi:Domain of unknown function (DUF4349)